MNSTDTRRARTLRAGRGKAMTYLIEYQDERGNWEPLDDSEADTLPQAMDDIDTLRRLDQPTWGNTTFRIIDADGAEAMRTGPVKSNS